MKLHVSHLITTGLILLLGLNSCKKDDAVATPSTGTLMLHMHNNLGSKEIQDYNRVYSDSVTNGRKFLFTKAQLYLSHIQLIKADGTIAELKDQIVLKKEDQEEYELGQIPAGNYTRVRFLVGLDATVNAKTPTTSATDPLNAPDMWFGSTAQPSGYVYINVQGKFDTSATGQGDTTNMLPFVYELGTPANAVIVEMTGQTQTVVAGQAAIVHIDIDYYQLLEAIPLPIQGSVPQVLTVQDNSSATAKTLVSRIQSMFRYE